MGGVLKSVANIDSSAILLDFAVITISGTEVLAIGIILFKKYFKT